MVLSCPLASLCLSYHPSFSAPLREVDGFISRIENEMSILPRSDPRHTLCVQYLARGRLTRYLRTGQKDDLERSILGFTEAIYLPLPLDPHPGARNIVQLFCSLSISILLRVELSSQPEDVKCCIMHLRYLYGQWHEVQNDTAFTVRRALVSALAIHVDLGLGDVYRDIEEIADLCEAPLDLDTSIESLSFLINLLVRAVKTLFEGPLERQILSEKVLDRLRKAVIRLPDLHVVSIVLAESLLHRFYITASDDDYKEGMTIVDNLIGLCSPGGGQSIDKERALHLAANFAFFQFYASGKPDHLEDAIYRLRTRLDATSISLEDPHRDNISEILSELQTFRTDITSNARNAPHTLSSISGSVKLPSFQDLISSLTELDPLKTIPTATLRKHQEALENIHYLSNLADIEDGVEYCRRLLDSFPDSELVPEARFALGHLLYRAFKCANKIEYLDEAISATRDYISTIQETQWIHFRALMLFPMLLTQRFQLRHQNEDLDELMEHYEKLSNIENEFFVPKVEISCDWAFFAREFGHPSVSTAYESAMSSMQASLIFAPTIDIQHSRLVTMEQLVKTLPLDYASYQIHTGQLERAIETLERGRALLWSEMRGLRTTITQIALSDSNLAENFSMLNQDLEKLTLAFSQNSHVDGGDNILEGTNPYRDLVMQQQKLLHGREKLISQIQALPGLDTFLESSPFDALRSAACRGPVIIINHSQWRSDIIIVLHNSPPSLISTSDDFFDRAEKLQDQLLEERRKGLESDEYEDTLRSVLKELYELVGRPVIERLNELKVPEQSRIWWCQTSVFCSLPLHAMGPIQSNRDPPQYFLDLYIPSYIPSLSTLIESRKPGSQAIGKPSILLVAQPDETMPGASREMKAVQDVDTKVTTLFGAKAKPTAVLEGMRHHPFAHIVCHGILNPGKPFETSFKLHKGKRLLLLDIVRSQLPDAEFAFLSACHTAELTEESISDEVLHLAASMQFCGFRSVVGTMWAMQDKDGRDLARYFYESVFSSETQDVPYHERTAEALRDAVTKLRRKGGMTLERWVNYVHYGA